MERLSSLLNRLAEQKSTVQSKEDELKSLSNRDVSIQKALFWTRSTLAAKCIKYRNNLSAEAIKQDFANSLREMGREHKGDLKVFCVAATIFLSYESKNNRGTLRLPGFQTIQDTQIPALRDWLIGTTLNTRDRYALAFLEDVENFVNWMQPWMNDKYGDTKMTVQTRERWEPELDQKVLELESVCFRNINVSLVRH